MKDKAKDNRKKDENKYSGPQNITQKPAYKTIIHHELLKKQIADNYSNKTSTNRTCPCSSVIQILRTISQSYDGVRKTF